VKDCLSQTCATCALVFVLILASIGAVAAHDPIHRYRHHTRHTHAAYADPVPNYRECRAGWWQSLYYGHVRPRWEVWCR
jgi:hypothetical protein